MCGTLAYKLHNAHCFASHRQPNASLISTPILSRWHRLLYIPSRIFFEISLCCIVVLSYKFLRERFFKTTVTFQLLFTTVNKSNKLLHPTWLIVTFCRSSARIWVKLRRESERRRNIKGGSLQTSSFIVLEGRSLQNAVPSAHRFSSYLFLQTLHRVFSTAVDIHVSSSMHITFIDATFEWAPLERFLSFPNVLSRLKYPLSGCCLGRWTLSSTNIASSFSSSCRLRRRPAR